VHGIAIGAGCKETGGQRLLTVSGAVGLLGWVAGGVLLLVQRACRDPAAGAFALPLVLAAVLPGVFAPGTGGRGVTPALATVPALRLHATAAAAGIAWRLRETSRPVSMRKIVGPPLGMSTGLAMFLAPAARVRWAWAGVAEIG